MKQLAAFALAGAIAFAPAAFAADPPKAAAAPAPSTAAMTKTSASASVPETLGQSVVRPGWAGTRLASRVYGNGGRAVMARLAKANPNGKTRLPRIQ